jgi:hypothetical protein
MADAPCKDCKGRHLGCHDACEKYPAYHWDNMKRLEESRVQSVLNNDHAFIVKMAKLRYNRRRK